ncbi:MAG: hypothetical protein ACI9KN_002203 [Gammaproteobacteria bacterium]|jgi:hypothetical protein
MREKQRRIQFSHLNRDGHWLIEKPLEPGILSKVEQGKQYD